MPPVAPPAPAVPASTAPAAAPAAPPAPTGIVTERPTAPKVDVLPQRTTPRTNKMLDGLDKLTPEGKAASATPPKTGEPPKAAEPPKAPDGKPEVAPADVDPNTPPADPNAAPAKGGKQNPWKVVDTYKAKVADLEKQLSERGKIAPEEKTKLDGRIVELEKKLSEYENEIQFVNYSKSAEFKAKYQEPYQKAWKSAMEDLGELTVEDTNSPNGQRAITTADITELVNLNIADARKVAEEKFGAFANDIMAHRKEIRKLFQAQSEALETAKTTAGAREKERSEQAARIMAGTQKVINDTWEEANQSVLNDESIGEYFKPDDKDPEYGNRLTKGYKFVDESLGKNAFEPGLSDDDRKEIVRNQAVVRNRAAAFGAMRHRITTMKAQIAALTKQIEEFKGSTPPVGGSGPATQPQTGGSATSRLFSKLESIAK